MLSSRRVRTSDRPPEVRGRTRDARACTLTRILAAAALCSGLLFVSNAWGGFVDRPRTDGGEPPVNPGGTGEGWWLQTIPGVSAQARLGDVWVSPTGLVYVWSVTATTARPAGASFGESGEGERLPNGDPRPDPVSSTLYRFDGLRWSAVLHTESETGVALYGTDDANVYASTTGAHGDARLYRFDGASWRAEPVPGYHLGRLHTMAGVRGDLYFRVDRVLMCDRDDGRGLQPVFEEAGEHQPVRGIVYLGPQHVVVMHADGHSLYHNGVWSDRTAAPFSQVEDAWGTLAADGRMQLFALGSTQGSAGIRLWQFSEDDPGTHAGTWRCMLADPELAAPAGTGCGLHVWGTSTSDVYATGMCEGESHLLRRDGATWTQLSPPAAIGPVHGVWGTPSGAVWFSADGGQVVRYLREAAPVPAPLPAGAGHQLGATVAGNEVSVRYELAEATAVRVTVHDVTGRLCATLTDGPQGRGVHELVWSASDLHPGVYFLRLKGTSFERGQRIVIMR